MTPEGPPGTVTVSVAPGTSGPVDQAAGRSQVDVDGLFDHDVLAGPGRRQADFGVLTTGHRHTYDLDATVAQELVERSDICGAVLDGERFALFSVNVVDSREGRAIHDGASGASRACGAL